MAAIDAPAYRRTWVHYIGIVVFGLSWAVVSAIGWFVQLAMDETTRGIVTSVDGYPVHRLIGPLIATLFFWLAVFVLVAWKLR